MVEFEQRLGVVAVFLRPHSPGLNAFFKFTKNSAVWWSSRCLRGQRNARTVPSGPTLWSVAFGFCSLVPTHVFAQAVYVSIFGTLTDQSETPVVGATVDVPTVQTG